MLEPIDLELFDQDLVLEPASFEDIEEPVTRAPVRRAPILRWFTGFAEVEILERRNGTVVVSVAPNSTRPTPRTPVTIEEGGTKQRGRMAATQPDGALVIAIGERGVRAHPRVVVNVRGLCAVDAHDWQPVEVVDLSRSGVRIRGVHLPLGARINLYFVVPLTRRTIQCRAEVVRRGDDGSLGLAFCLFSLPEGIFSDTPASR